jgi:hypothetical protein
MNMAGKENIVIPDSLPQNNIKYYYRMYGVTIFGEKGPYSNIISGVGFKNLTSNPSINEYYSNDKGEIHLSWDFNESDNELIKYFELRHAISPNIEFKPIVKEINAKTRSIVVKRNEPSNYFVLAAIPHKGDETVSLPVFVQLVDSIPPSAPKGLKGEIGLVRQWTIIFLPKWRTRSWSKFVYNSNKNSNYIWWYGNNSSKYATKSNMVLRTNWC